MKRMVAACYDKCAGTSVSLLLFCTESTPPVEPYAALHFNGLTLPLALFVSMPTLLFSHHNVCSMLCFCYKQGDKLDSREQSCMAVCQDRYLETRAQVQETLMKRQGNAM